VKKMSFSSRSSKSNHYKGGNYGSSHYQQKGFFGNLLNLVGSGRNSNGFNNQYTQPLYNQPELSPREANTGTIICSKCKSEIPRGSKFCLECGEKTSDGLHCTNCGEILPPNAKFCLQCGTKVSG
jgi:ribosomal protein L40E